ncbi:hypothetical protein [Halomarina litorea]|uniref:hypothetical protein n=1 Tax=Halomarina litorea TaxID=2961595 RepID=UPI0020C46DFF|nr:hypothetical protein [Halomarina sp. BCD28]
MTDVSTASTAGTTSTAAGTTSLRPFTGLSLPGVCFESGHCVWLLDFESTPTPYGGYTEVWVIGPDGDRTLYVSEEEAIDTVCEYHDFDATHAAEVTVERDDERLTLSTTGEDGTRLDCSLAFESTPATRLLGAVARATPSAIARSGVGRAVSTFSLNALLGLGGLPVGGRTETGREYFAAADRMYLVGDATATLDGTDLGGVVRPPERIAFGDIVTTDRPVAFVGDLFLEYAD